MQKFIDLYRLSPTMEDWTKQNQPDKDLLWKAGVPNQAQRFMAMAPLLSVEAPKLFPHTQVSL